MKYKFAYFMLIGIISAFITIAFSALGRFSTWDLKLSDFLYDKENRTNDNIVIIGIDDKSLENERLGRWQEWKRSYYADLIKSLNKYSPAVIGLDILLSESSRDKKDDKILSETLKNNKNIVLAAAPSLTSQEAVKPIKAFAENSSVGIVHMVLDSDTVMRSELLFSYGYENFSLEIIRKYLGIGKDESILNGTKFKFFTKKKRPSFDLSISYSPITVPIDKDGKMMINFFGRPGSYRRISFIDAIEGRISEEDIKNKIVLVGETATGLFDESTTPVSEGINMPGVEIHANAIQTILEQKFLVRQTIKNLSFWLIIISLTSSLIFGFSRPLISLILAVSEFLAVLTASVAAFENYRFITRLFYLIFCIILVYVLILLYRYIVEGREKRYLHAAFSHYVAPSVVKEIVKNPKMMDLGGVKKEITAFFSDIQGFTTISEKMDSVALVKFLNSYTTAMTDIILSQKGTLDKYEGDAIMAFWGAPVDLKDHAKRACFAAIENISALKKMKTEWAQQGYPEISIRIGINTGEMVVGNMGSKERFDYTLLGDEVNLASRLEGVNKQYSTHIIISGSTYEQAKDTIEARELDLIRVKGKEKAVKIYELISYKGKIDSKTKKLNEIFAEALVSYKQKKWDNAEKSFNKCLMVKKDDGPSITYLRRIELFKKYPPGDDWDGVFKMETK